MKSFRVSQVMALLAMTALGLSACNDGEPDTPTENEDPAVTSAEVTEAPAVGPQAMFAKIFADADKDNDGKVTEAEARAAATVKFTDADKNQDGYLERDEMIAMRKAHFEGRRGAGMRGGKAGPGERGLRFFQKADADGDGKLSKTEAPERMAAHFEKIDADGDGFVTPEELKAMWGKGGPGRGFGPMAAGGPGRGPGGGPMAMMDTDGDGKISSAEWVNGHVERMKKADANGDGAVTMEELSAAAKQFGHFGPGRMGRMGRGGMGHGFKGGMRGMHGERATKRFAEMDANNDGKVTKAEADAARAARFAEIDSNKDGVLETAELTAHHEAMRATHMAERFASLDADGNGSLSQSEAPPFMAQRFQEVDKDGNGAISVEEMKAARESHKIGPQKDRGPRMLRMDADKDGKITASEFEQKHAGWFERADSNGDGVVTLEELQAGKGGGPGCPMKR